MNIDWENVRKSVEGFGSEIYPFETCEIGEQLGVGASMSVHKGTCVINEETTPVAFKFHRRWTNQRLRPVDVNDILQEFRHEITLMKKLKFHPNIVQILGVTFKETLPILVVELGDETLEYYLSERYSKKQQVSWFDKTTICLDVLSGVRGLHQAGVIHGDLKGENVLVFVSEEGFPRAKISDFGFSSSVSSSCSHVGGTRNFLAPENTPNHPELFSWCKKPAQDIYGLGMVTFQIATDGERPYEDALDVFETKAADPNLMILLAQLPLDTPKEFRQVIIMTTRLMPSQRASLNTIEKLLRNVISKPLSESPSEAATEATLVKDVAISEYGLNKAGQRQAAKDLLEDYVKQQELDLTNATKDDLIKPLLWASGEGHLEIIRILVEEYGADVNCKSKNGGTTPLHRAAGGRRIDAVKTLVRDFKANVNATDKSGETPLHKAAWGGDKEIVKLLVQVYGVDVNAKTHSGETALHKAAENGHLDVVKSLAGELLANANTSDTSGLTALHRAAGKGRTHVVRALIEEYGADVNANNFLHETPLHKAAQKGYADVVKILAGDFGANVNAKKIYGDVPLHYAAANGHTDVINILVSEFGVDVKARTDIGWTAMHFATRENHAEVIRVLADFGANTEEVDDNGWTPFHVAAYHGRLGIAQVLMEEYHADINRQVTGGLNKGYTALDLAMGRHNDIYDVVKQAGGVSGISALRRLWLSLIKID